MAANSERTLKEIGNPIIGYQPLCIQMPIMHEGTLKHELKFMLEKIQMPLIHLLPKFHGLVGKDIHKHLKEFHVVCSTMKPTYIIEDLVKMKAFPFSLN